MTENRPRELKQRLVEDEDKVDEELDDRKKGPGRRQREEAEGQGAPQPPPKKPETIPICGIFKLK